jgi:hypothetical protein
MPNKWAKTHAVVRIMMVNSPTYLKPYDQWWKQTKYTQLLGKSFKKGSSHVRCGGDDESNCWPISSFLLWKMSFEPPCWARVWHKHTEIFPGQRSCIFTRVCSFFSSNISLPLILLTVYNISVAQYFWKSFWKQEESHTALLSFSVTPYSSHLMWQ